MPYSVKMQVFYDNGYLLYQNITGGTLGGLPVTVVRSSAASH